MTAPLKQTITELRRFFVLNKEKRAKYTLNPDKNFTRNSQSGSVIAGREKAKYSEGMDGIFMNPIINLHCK